jgi:hypothetical protein
VVQGLCALGVRAHKQFFVIAFFIVYSLIEKNKNTVLYIKVSKYSGGVYA